MDSIGLDSLSLIFGHLDTTDWFNIMLVCKQYRKLGSNLFNPTDYAVNILGHCIRCGYTSSVRVLLADSRIDPNSDIDMHPLCIAAMQYDKVCLQLLLDTESVKLDSICVAISIVTSKCTIDLMRMIAQHPRLSGIVDVDFCISTSIDQNRFDLADFWISLHTQIDKEIYLSMLVKLLRTDLISAVMSADYIITKFEFHQHAKNLVRQALKCNLDALVGTYLYRYPWLLESGDVDILLLAIQNRDITNTIVILKSVKPTNECLIAAVKAGCLPIVIMLATKEYINTTDALVEACMLDEPYIAEYLVSLSKTDPSTKGDYAIQVASEHGWLKLVRMLLADSRVDPSSDYNYCISVACQGGHVEIASLLLADSRVDPATDRNYPLRIAVMKGYHDLVTLLLPHIEIPPDAKYLLAAIKRCYPNVVRALLADNRIQPDEECLLMAQEKGYGNILDMLLERL